jgi:hypothetical protein
MAGRALVLGLAAASFAFALRSPDRDRAVAAVRYRCPMHPDAASGLPGACPICGMALVRERAYGSAPAVLDDVPDRAHVARAVRRVFSEDVRAPAWVDDSGAVVAMLYRDDLVGLAPGQPARFFPATAPSVGADVALAAGAPGDWDDSTASARFAASGDGAGLRPGDQGSLVIAARPRELVVVPTSAVVNAAAGPCVFVVDATTQRLARRAVRVGRPHQGVTVIAAGISDGEQVAVGNAFFLDAERRSAPEVAP